MGHSESRKPQAQLSLQEKLDQARADLAKWSQLAASPNLSPPAALAARNMARSSQAAVTLGEKALAYQQESHQNLARVLGIVALGAAPDLRRGDSASRALPD
jgi:hypothetical protein